jgi:hypothetical protein
MWLRIVVSLALTALPAVALAQQMFIYPDRGQTPDQQARDRWECHNWAVQQTGFDPSAPQMAEAAPPPPPPSTGAPQGGLFRGAAGGAALGAVGGAIGGDAGKGAAIGAAVGGLFGVMRRAEWARQQEQTQMQYQQQVQAVAAQQSAARAGANANYNRAFGVCMNGRGYQVG